MIQPISVRIALVSSSPRRREILKMTGFNFRVVKGETEEKLFNTPEETAVKNAELKVLSARELLPEEVALAADTIVVSGNRILGKPKDREEAVDFLKRLSGTWHRVLTGFALRLPDGKLISSFEESRVKFKRLTLEEIRWYISTGEPLDKAGAYGIQGYGALFIERIEGDFFNVMGLPVGRIYDILKLEFE